MTTHTSYVPRAGTPTVVFLAALAAATALPTVYLLQGSAPPLWITAVTFALLLAAVIAVPTLNARTRPEGRRTRAINIAALVGAIVVPALLLVAAAALPALGWLMAVAVGVQVALLAVSGILAMGRGGPKNT